VRKEFIVERQGRAFCLYAGLLDQAHQQGLKSIQTQLIQTPSEENGHVAICSATVTMVAQSGPESDGVERAFSGIGDAAPNNVAPAMRTCLLRMAETRAKARALRDAVNIGVAAFEELGEEDAHDGAPERGYAVGAGRQQRPERPAPVRREPVSAPVREAAHAPESAPAPRKSDSAEQDRTAVAAKRADSAVSGGDLASDSQLEAIRNLSRRNAADHDALAMERYGAKSIAALSPAQAAELIRELNGRSSARARVA
jgi:hypothetical protein